MKKKLIFIMLFYSLVACSHSDVYKTIQTNGQLECQRVPPSEYDDCMKAYSESYESYKRRRDDLDKKPT